MTATRNDERMSDDKPRGGGVDVDQVTLDLAEEWLMEIKAEVAKKLEIEQETEEASSLSLADASGFLRQSGLSTIFEYSS